MIKKLFNCHQETISVPRDKHSRMLSPLPAGAGIVQPDAILGSTQ